MVANEKFMVAYLVFFLTDFSQNKINGYTLSQRRPNLKEGDSDIYQEILLNKAHTHPQVCS